MEAKNKLYELEITPPPGVWQHIATALDEADNGLQYPAALHSMTATPPAGTWNKIAAQLYNATPARSTVAQKLLALEIIPPATAWQQIEAGLGAGTEAPAPEKRRLFPLFRYAAAAVITGLLAWAGIALLNNRSSPAGTSTKGEQALVQPEKNHIPDINTQTANAGNLPDQHTDAVANASDEARNDAALEESKKTFARLDINPVSKLKAAADFYFAEPAVSVNTRGLHTGDDNDVPQYTPSPESEPSRYIMLLTPEGHIIRMSKKLSNMVCCVSGEEQDKECKEQMRKWREKLACSPANHSPGNFLDILSLAHALQQDNQ